MTAYLRKKINESAGARWAAMILVSLTMMMGYFLTDVMSPLESLVCKSAAEGGLGWSSAEYGFFSGAYGYFNVFLLMLFFGGIILDKMGFRFTGILACILMITGGLIKWFAVSMPTDGAVISFLGGDYHVQVLMAALGFAIFGVGNEICGITVSKVVVKWFTGHELALAMGIQVGMARVGTAIALSASFPIAQHFGGVSASILLAVLLVIIGLLCYIVYCVMDVKYDKAVKATAPINNSEEAFQMHDVLNIVRNRGFWYITFLCLLFYSGLHPFIKFASQLMIFKYHVSSSWAGTLVSLLPLGTILFTPIFGSIYDTKGKGVTLMTIGCSILTFVHLMFTLPVLGTPWFAVVLMFILCIAFSLVPAVMWPSIPKIIPMKQLGTANALIFYIQNIGLSMVPVLIGWTIEHFAKTQLPDGNITYNYTIPMAIFMISGLGSILFAMLLRVENKRKNYGLEEPNIKRTN